MGAFLLVLAFCLFYNLYSLQESSMTTGYSMTSDVTLQTESTVTEIRLL